MFAYLATALGSNVYMGMRLRRPGLRDLKTSCRVVHANARSNVRQETALELDRT